jgi:hypothetical protein
LAQPLDTRIDILFHRLIKNPVLLNLNSLTLLEISTAMKRTSLSKIAQTTVLIAVLGVIAGIAPAKSIANESPVATAEAATRYADGRTSQVRTFPYFDYYRDKKASAARQPANLIVVVVEWGRYDAVVGDRQSAFAQLPTNTMVGGDGETDNRVSKPSKAFFATARQTFTQQRDNLTRINKTVPNRNIDLVSFDFVTNQGTFTVQQDRRTLENGTSPWSKMFREARALREDIRRAASRQ